jgi:hypothetical protein
MRKDTLLMRFIDDFICITPERSVAEAFLARMRRGFPEFNAYINDDKTVVSFEHHDFETFSWCGLDLDPTTLAIRVPPEKSGKKHGS